MEMQYPQSMDPRFDTEPERCTECDEPIYPSNESDTPKLCSDCFNYENNESILDDFVNDVFRPMFEEPDFESMLIHKS